MTVTMKHLHADTYGVWISGHPTCAQGSDRRVAFVRDVPKTDVLFIPQHFLAESEQGEVVEAVKAWHASSDEMAKSFANPEKKL
jgi:hypothetical protein